MSLLYLHVYAFEGRLHRFAAMFSHALLLVLSKKVIVTSCIWDKADTYC